MIFISGRIIIRNNTFSTKKIRMIHDLFLSELRQFFALKRLSVLFFFGGEGAGQRGVGRGRVGSSAFSTTQNLLVTVYCIICGQQIFSQLIMSIFVFSQYFFSIAFADWKVSCILYHDSLTLKFTFKNIRKFDFDISCLVIASKK